MPPPDSVPLGQTAHQAEPTPTAPRTSSLAAQLRALWRDSATLARQELKLVHLELAEKATLVARGAMLLVAAATLLIVGVFHLSNAALGWLSMRVDPLPSMLLIGGTTVGLGVLLVVVAQRLVEPKRLALHRTLQSLQREHVFAREPTP
ncbi:MAG: phage holin family protein [Myxococcota bacterium]